MLLKILDVILQIFVFCVIFGGFCFVLYVVNKFLSMPLHKIDWLDKK